MAGRTVTIYMDSETQVAMQHATDHDEWFRALGRLCAWMLNTYPNVAIYADGQTNMTAVYTDAEGNYGFTLGAFWHGDRYDFHS